MKKRLRKKLGVGEFFQEWVEISGNFKEEIKLHNYMDKFIDDVCEFSDLINICFSGMTSENGFSHYHHGFKKILKEEQIQKTIQWYKDNSFVDNNSIKTVILRTEKEEEIYLKELDRKEE